MTRAITDKKELYKLISYLTMSDGGVYLNKKNGKQIGNARFVMTQRDDHLDFCEYASDILSNVTNVKIKRIDRSKDKDANRQNQYRVETNNHPVFTQMRERIYIDNYKSIDPHYLKALDWESLSILYMSDGCLSKYFKPEAGMVNPSYNLTLNMKRLSYGDQVLIKRALEEKQMGAWSVCRHNQYYYLRLSTKFIPLFMENIYKFIVPSYRYKIVERLTPDIQGDDIVWSS